MRVLATAYFKLLAIKDEYEVARLFTQIDLKAQLDAEFTGQYSLSLNLSPLGFASWNKHLNQPKKYRIGSWMLLLMKPLAMLKGLRGCALDPFSYHPERKAEREFLVYFLAQTEVLMGLLNAHNQSSILAALSLFDDVRGYGHVRTAAMTKAKVLMATALQELHMDEQAYAA